MGASALDTGCVEPEVNIQQTRLTPYNLPLHQQWRSRGQNFSSRHGWLLELEDSDGIKGYGDCAPLPCHGTESETIAQSTLESELTKLTGSTPKQALGRLPNLKQSPAARCALETALLDLITQRESVPLRYWLNPKANSQIRVNANIGALGEGAPDRARTAIGQGYSTLKLKVGVSDPSHELMLLKQLCSDLPKSIKFRLDANMAWDIENARVFLQGISGLPIESLEEPLARPDIRALAQLQGETKITLALDETVAGMNQHDLSQLGHLRRIILKPTVHGGLLPSLQLGQHAQEHGIEVVVTTTVDSAAGVWAATQLAAALDSTGQLCHGLGTGGWLQRDLGDGPDIQNGIITLAARPGLGFRPFD